MRTVRRRRKENKTDYLTRLKLLKSEKPRVVFRKSNRYLTAQYVTSEEAKDKVIFGINSKKLLNFGWPKEFENSLKSIPAAYCLGLLIGKEVLKRKLESPIVDFGMVRTVKKNKLYGFLKGLIDSGLEISCPKEAFPEEERISGKNLKKDFSEYFKKIKLEIEKV